MFCSIFSSPPYLLEKKYTKSVQGWREMHNQLWWQLLRGQRFGGRYNTLGISARGGTSKTLWDKRLGLAYTQRTLFSGIVRTQLEFP